MQKTKTLSKYKDELSGKNLPVFITETGWSHKKLSENQIAQYFSYAFESIWSDNNIVAVTPFLLRAGVEPFLQFSLLNENGDYNEVSRTLQKISKIKGEPVINYGLNISSDLSKNIGNIQFKTFPKDNQYESSPVERAQAIKPFLKWLLKLSN